MKSVLNTLLMVCFLGFPTLALAQEEVMEQEPASTLKAHFRRVALDFSNTSVSHAKEYKDSPVSELSADSEMVIKGVFDFILEYDRETIKWNNSLYAEYGKTKLKNADGERSSNENADQILLTTDLMKKVWMWEAAKADVGPFTSLSYQTEFTQNQDAPRNKVARLKAGIKAFNGAYIEELYAAAVGEADFTYSDTVAKSAWEVGFRAKYPLREGVDFSAEGYYRDYLTFSSYEATDLKYDLNVVGRMDVKISKTLSLAPYVSYRYAKARGASVTGSNFMIGLSFAYADLFDLIQ